MKQAKLLRIKLTNFKSQNLEIEFGSSTKIYWPNGAGKSTILNAFAWALTGADKLNRTNYELYDARVAPTFENSPTAMVELWLDIDGEVTEIKRKAQPQWSRSGSRQPSDKYEIFVDGMKMTAGAFKAFMANTLMPIPVLKFMFNPMHYLNVDWRELSEMLCDVIGKIDESDFKRDYAPILPMLRKYGEETAQAMLADTINKNKKKLHIENQRLEIMRTQLPDLSDVARAEKEREQKVEQIAKIKAAIKELSVEKDEAAAKRRTEAYREYEAAAELYAQHRDEFYASERELEKRINQQKADAESNVRELTSCYDKLYAALSAKEAELEQMRSASRDARTNTCECPYCHRELTVEESAKMLAEHTERGKTLKSEVESIRIELEKLCQQIDEAIKIADSFVFSHVTYDTSEQAKAELAEMERLFALAQPPRLADNQKNLNEAHEALREEIRQLDRIVDKRSEYAAKLQSIEEAEGYNRTIATAITIDIGKAELFKLREAELLAIVKARIGKLLTETNVKVESSNKSERIKSVCSLLVGGVPAECANFAAQTIAGIDLAAALMHHYDIAVPLFIDDAEHITRDVPRVPSQTIELFASKETHIER